MPAIRLETLKEVPQILRAGLRTPAIGRANAMIEPDLFSRSEMSAMRRVLVVDDEENIRLVLKTLLKRHGYEVEVADGGEAALALVDSFGPDVILTDVRMPKMGGLDLLATL